MELSEEEQLKSITEEFTEGVALFRKHECKQALEIFMRIDEDYKDSQYYSVLEIQNRSKFYKILCDARLNPVKIKNRDDEDYLYDGIFHLNAGTLDEALERFKYLEEKQNDHPYLNYLMSLVYLKKEDLEKSSAYLRKSVEKDDFYKIIAHNEPDFFAVLDHEEFSSIIE